MLLSFLKYILVICVVFCFSQPLVGQEAYTVVKLKNGSKIEGQLVEYKEGEYIKMDLGQNVITLDFASIKNIQHRNIKFEKPYNFNENGFYHHSNVSLMPGFLSSFNPVLGIGLDHSSGYLFNRWFGAGLNLGMFNYNPGSWEVIYSLAAEVRGYFLARRLSPYYVARSGYGFTHEGENFLEANGGFYFNPAIGIRFGSSSKTKFMLELGSSFQDAYFKQSSSSWWDTAIVEKDVRYQRFTIKMGILF